MIPDTERMGTSLYDVVADACKSYFDVKQEDGTIKKELMLDPEKVWWKTLIVNHPEFGRFAYELLRLENKAFDAKNHMSRERALVFANQLLSECSAYRRSIDAKSSESIRDKLNTQSTLIDKLNKINVEKSLRIDSPLEQGFWKGVAGRETEQEARTN